MDYRIVEKDAFYIMGKTGHIPLIYHGPNHHTADVWKRLRQEDLLVLMEYSEVDPKGILTAHEQTIKGNIAIKHEGDEILYCVGIVMEKPMPDRFKERFDILPFEASTWLVFSAMDNALDSDVLSTKHVYSRISEWLPISEYEETGSPCITWTESYDFSKPNRKSEIWVPVRKKV